MYFKRFEHIQYDPAGETATKEAVNIINSLLVKYSPVTNTSTYFFHTVRYGETPEALAHKYYGNIYYHWIVIAMNHVVDPFWDWAMDENTLSAAVTSRYGAGNEYDVHHLIYLDTEKRLDEVAQQDAQDYFDAEGSWPVNISPISNTAWETEQNNGRREVKILQTKYVRPFVNQFEDLMNRRAFA